MYAYKNHESVAGLKNDPKFTGPVAAGPVLIMSILFDAQRIVFWGTLLAIVTDLVGWTDLKISFFVWSLISQIVLKILTLWPYSLVAKRTHV